MNRLCIHFLLFAVAMLMSLVAASGAEYTRHICPGMTILETGKTDTVAAYDAKARELVIVAGNGDNEDTKTFDLSKFIVHNGSVTRWITEPKSSGRYEIHNGIKLVGKRFECALPVKSIQIFEVKNVNNP
jgi:galactan endo-1,6-beta-galactosidase